MIVVGGEKLDPKDVIRLWPEVRRWILDCAAIADVPITSSDLIAAEKTFSDWVKAPGYGRDNLGNAYRKDVDDLAELAWALLGNVRAAASRRREEFLAWLVIGNLGFYELVILDPLITAINELTAKDARLQADPRVYGPLVENIRWTGVKWSVTNASGEKHEVLYQKVGFIHCFSLSVIKLKEIVIPGRRQSEDMRKKDSRGSLIEHNVNVYKDRLSGVSIWAGTSGSTMDMIYFAKEVAQIKDPFTLTCLAWCAFAFFHIMPTGLSPTHTFHEVMRGAKHVAPSISYDPGVTRLPWVDPASVFLTAPKPKSLIMSKL